MTSFKNTLFIEAQKLALLKIMHHLLHNSQGDIYKLCCSTASATVKDTIF